MTKTHLGGSVWLHFSQSGLNTNRVLDKVFPQLPRNKSFSCVFKIRRAFGDIQPYAGSKVCTKQTQNWLSRSTSSWKGVKHGSKSEEKCGHRVSSIGFTEENNESAETQKHVVTARHCQLELGISRRSCPGSR